MMLMGYTSQMRKMVFQHLMVIDLLATMLGSICALFHIDCYIYIPLILEGVGCREPHHIYCFKAQGHQRTPKDVAPLSSTSTQSDIVMSL